MEETIQKQINVKKKKKKNSEKLETIQMSISRK